MGTKRHLAGDVCQLASDCRPGPLLDLFAGMCAIGRSLAPDRQIWTNDLQIFAYEVATAQFCSAIDVVDSNRIWAIAEPLIAANLVACEMAFDDFLDRERCVLTSNDYALGNALFSEALERAQTIRAGQTQGPKYSLFLTRFGGSYFGYRQSAEADSIRFALDELKSRGEILDDEYRWCLVALGMTLSRVSTTTGHFAQPLRPKQANSTKFFSQRARSVLTEWRHILPELRPSGDQSWRSLNRSFRSEAIDLLDDLIVSETKPALIYADPPYTKDQYSRYYHLLETVILYDYPSCEGTGLYRPDRVSSGFSQSARVEDEIDALIAGCRRLSADFIMSYPEDGLLISSRKIIPRIVREHYGKAPDVIEIAHNHSTMGASKGKGKHSVKEILYRVQI